MVLPKILSAPLLFAPCLLAGCSVPIVEADPRQAVDAAYLSALPSGGDRVDLAFWERIGDPQLTELLHLARASSPDLRTAAANVLSARASARETGAGAFPDLTGDASATRSRSAGITASDSSASLDASWEIDLFRRTANATNADRLTARSKEFSYAGAYVSLVAEVADDYVQYRACRGSEDIYRAALSSQRETLKATQDLVEAGLSSASDLSLARANVASAEISLRDQSSDCALTAQALATVAGLSQGETRAILDRGHGLPGTRGFRVDAVPSDMLRQRADVAAAELDFSAALLDMKVAQADLYPSLTLSGDITLTEPTGWSFGPALSLPIFDGGESAAAVGVANATVLSAAESYRSTVLEAVEDVENALTQLDAARRNLGSAQTMVAQYEEYFTAIDADWQAGGITLLDREDARRELQDAQITRLSQRETVLRQWIALYKAVGGGWTRPAADPS